MTDAKAQKCETCGDTGVVAIKVLALQPNPHGGYVDRTGPCPDCNGTGFVAAQGLATLSYRLKSDGGRYLFSVALTSEERRAMPEPTYGGKGHSRWLTEKERASLIEALEAYL